MVYRPHGLDAMSQTTQSTTDATLTEYLPAAQHADPSIDGAAKISCIKVGTVWQADEGEAVDELDEYRVECEACDAMFGNWGAAAAHAEEDH